MLRRSGRWLVLTLAGILCTVLVSEAGLRWFAPQEPPGMYTADDALGFRLTPGYRGVQSFRGEPIPLEFNSWGMRDREPDGRRAARQRILVLGDSFMFGHSVRSEESFPKQLEARLRARLGAEAVEVINAGVPRYGTSQQRKWFERVADAVQPDIVLLGMFVSNDIVDNLHFGRLAGEGAPEWRSRGLWNWLRVRSQLLIWLRHRRSTRSERPAHLARRAFETHARNPSPEIRTGIEVTESELRRLMESVQRRGARFVLLLIPEAVQVYPELWEESLRRLRLAATDYLPEEPSRHFAALGVAAGVTTLDLLPVLSARRADGLYLKLHWNPRGHAVAAAAVAESLLAGHMLATDP